jgi:hypothetical protein
MKNSRRARIASLILVLVLSASVPARIVGADETPDPAIGYWTDTNVVVTDADAQKIRRFPDFERFSLNGPVIAGERKGKRNFQRRIVAYDIASGERRFRIPDARNPVATAGGKRIAFLPTSARDDLALSVWMRMGTGRIRKLAQFSAGPGFPGIRHGMRGGAAPLDIAFDRRGRTMALVGGLETLRSFDVWLVDVKTKKVTRMTRGNHSHSPSLSPDGGHLAVRVESAEACPDDVFGEILIGKIRVISTATRERKTLTSFDCDLFYDTPRWIDNQSLLAVRVTKDDTESFGYDLDIVRIDVASGAITEVVTKDNPCCITTSPRLGKVAYEFTDRPGFTVYDLESETVVDFPEGHYVPHLAGENRF